MAAKMVRLSFTLPPSIQTDLDYLSSRIGVTRSAFLASLIDEPLRDLRVLMEQVPESPTPLDVVRFRGASVDVANERLQNLKGDNDDLFSK